MRSVAGVDGVGPLWVAAVHCDEGVRWHIGTAAEVLAATRGCATVAIDIPIGFVTHGPRSSEAQARDILGPDRSSVFPTPPAAAFAVARELGTGRHVRVAAQLAARSAGGAGISAQSWAITAKILEVEDAVRSLGSSDASRVVETHPETAFRVMADPGAVDGTRRAFWPGKRSAAGAGRRLAALGIAPEQLDDPVLSGVPVDDALDALAAAWSARRVADGVALQLGSADAASAVWSDSTPAPGRAVIWV